MLHRIMLDAPRTVRRGVVLDSAPTDLMHAATNQEFAPRYFWW